VRPGALPSTAGDGRLWGMDKNATVTSRAWEHGKVVAENFTFEEISDYLDRDCVVWVDLPGTDAESLAALADEMSINQTLIEDALAEHERPKIYHFDKFKFLTAYSVTVDDEGTLDLSRISAFVTHQAMVTVRRGGFDLEQLLKRWDDNREAVGQGAGGLVHGLLDLIVDGHFDAVQQLDDAMEGIEDALFAEKPQNKTTQLRAFRMRKALVELRRVVLPMRELVGSLQREDAQGDPVLRPYFDDLYDHVLRVTEWTESLRDMVSSIFETNLSLADARLNTIMKKLTAWAAIIAVPTAVTGFYGQNVPYPGFSHYSGFVASSAIMAVTVVVLYVIFRKNDWL
jgi:magnesium transporter